MSDRVEAFLDRFWFSRSPAIRALILFGIGVLAGGIVF